MKKSSRIHDFPKMEKKWLKSWEKSGLYRKYLNKNKDSKEKFSFFDGPITANNAMGIHHAWGRTYKDIYQKFHNLLGKEQRFQNGFDCQGLWVEVEVEKELGLKNKQDIENLVKGNKKASIAKFVKLCKDRVKKYSHVQTEQSKRLGYFMNWDNSYFTMSKENNYMIWHFLKVVYENGWIYKGRDSVPWCPRCQTAISQHEMLTEDYKDVVHESIVLSFPIIGKSHEFLLVWTTTPWTIPANIAVAVDKKINYSLVRDLTSKNNYWVAKDLIKQVFKNKKLKVIKTVKGKKLVGLKYKAPFDNLPAVKKVAENNVKTFHTVIETDNLILPISLEEGTGLVHTAVSAGQEDFKLGKKYKLPMIPVINDEATYIKGLGFLTGKNAKKHPKLILDYLVKKDKQGENWVFDIFNFKHRYPACWRCKTELVWKVNDEWYISMDKPSKNLKKGKRTLREKMMKVAKKINWLPEFGLDRELDWLKNMHDWLISKKNRYWGLSLPIYECVSCKNFEVIGSKEELKKRAVCGWNKFKGHSPHKPYIDEVEILCSNCNKKVKRIDDVGNPWLDAGIIPFSTLVNPDTKKLSYLGNKKYFKKWFPADFITESFPGQFKNWFYSMIAMSTVLEDSNSFNTVLGFGTLTDEKGKPMHKSWGNDIEFNKGADNIGVDVMRWMYLRQNPADNLHFGYSKADQVRRQIYLMLWNIYKFYIEYSKLDKVKVNIDFKQQILGKEKMNILDEWILTKFYLLIDFVEKSLKKYNAKDATLEIEKFINDVSTWYIRRSRERIWIHSSNTHDKNMFYNTLYYLLTNSSVILSPFLPFITEEIYTNLTNLGSVHLSSWPKLENKSINKNLLKDMDLIRTITETGHRKRKELSFKVRQPLSEVKVIFPKNIKFLIKENEKEYKGIISQELNVKKVAFSFKTNIKEIAMEYDTKLTPSLIKEGKLRDLIREIQVNRKKLGTKPDEYVDIQIPEKYLIYEKEIKKKVFVNKIISGNKLKVII